MEMDTTVEQATEKALSRLAEKHTEIAFNDLLSYASEVCLRRPPKYLSENEQSKYENVSVDERVAQRLGARGLSTLLETTMGMHPALSDLADDESSEYVPGKQGFHISENISNPISFSNPLNLRILENAERFGQALINESFAVLGDQAEVWAERLKNASSSNEERQAVFWLENRIHHLSRKSKLRSSEEDEKAHFYPPYRIAPKFIGTYPNINIQPSCLSTSIIATSFFEKAGKPTLHAGVTSPSQDVGTRLLSGILSSIANRESDTPDHDQRQLLNRINAIEKTTREWKDRPIAQHGAVYVKLSQGWLQFDTYGDATTALFTDDSEHINTLYESITRWHDVIPNIEFSTSTAKDVNYLLSEPKYSALSYFLGGYEYGDATVSLVERISQSLETIPDESYETYLLTQCLKPLLDVRYHPFTEQSEDGGEFLMSLIEDANSAKPLANGYSTALREAFSQALDKFVFWGASTEEFIAKCAKDPEYRRRRAEDFIAVPKLIGVYLAKEIAESNHGYGHLAIDIGSPAMRIGLATLSDFAQYDDNPLPASFWVSHWPGAASVYENLDNPAASTRDIDLLYNALVTQSVHPFTTHRNYDKITSFLSSHGEEKEDGNEQG